MYVYSIPIIALLASLLTFFSGFGLGTLLTPAFALFFPIEIAIALTAIVHFITNIFKLALIGKNIDFKTGIPFAAFAIIGSFIGAMILQLLSKQNLVLYTYTLFSHTYTILLTKLIIGCLILFFTLLDLLPRIQKKEEVLGHPSNFWGGILSGFFGGISGNQGAIRGAFLIKSNLSKMAYVATGTFIACCIDCTRLSVYFKLEKIKYAHNNSQLLISTIVCACLGVILGNRLLKKVSLQFVRIIVTTLLLLIGSSMIIGLL